MADQTQEIDNLRPATQAGDLCGKTLAVTATFTADLVKEPLEFWVKQLDLRAEIKFAPFNQIFQQLLDPASLLGKNLDGANIILLRIEDLQTTENGRPDEIDSQFESSIDELLVALRASAQRSAIPHLVFVCPPSEAVRVQPEVAHATERAVVHLTAGALDIPGVQVVTPAELLEQYPVVDYADEYGYQLGQIPYKPAFFTVLATAIARRAYRASTNRHSVIVLDCDDVLWKGAKDTANLQVDPPHVALQDFMIAQEDAGMILCLCSANAEHQLARAFENIREMRLGWQHIAASRFGRQPKSESIKELAEELGLPLDAFIFVTADPSESTEVRAGCPAVLVARLPSAPDQIPSFLANFWGFDRIHSVSGTAQASLPSQSASTFREDDRLFYIATRLADVDAITQAIESEKVLRTRGDGIYVPPRSPIEQLLADLWARLLSVDRVGIHDNFFALGGHSLRAVQLIARLRQILGVEMPLRVMFDSPTIAEFAERVEAERRSNSGVVIPPLKPIVRQGALPLSFAQQRMWFIDQLEPGNPLYNVPSAYRMRGTLNVRALEATINEILRRHESLRTTFRNVDGQPVQVITREIHLPLEVIDVKVTGEEQLETQLRRLTNGVAARAFDLAKGPLLRATLYRINDEDHVLVIVVHHIVGDGWSEGLMSGEIAALYEAFAEGRPSPLPDLAIQYADYAAWQREWVCGEFQDSQVDYWRKQLGGAPAVLELPTDRPRPALQSHRGDIETHLIPRDLIDRLRILANTEGTTLFMTLLASFQLLLARYSGREDIVVGSPIAGRNYADIEPLIGFFVSTLALRTDLSGDPTFRQLLARVRQVALEAYDHQHIPFEAVVESLQPERSLSYNPIFQVLFALQNVPERAFAVSSLRVERTTLHTSTSMFDMSWFGFETADGLLLRVEYDTDLFEGATIRRAIRHFEKLLEGIAAHSDSHISELPLLDNEEKLKILVEFNQTSADYPKTDLLHDFVARQAERTPDAPAIVFGSDRLTYRELNIRANQLARYLIKQGAGPEVLVGIYCERSTDMLVGILGILKSGSAYVPLDPNYPAQRIQQILEDANAPIVLTQKALAHSLANSPGQRICLDADWHAISQEPLDNPPSTVKPGNLAYVLFTSGSTGRPKGVAIEHRSAAAFIYWANSVFAPNELAGVLLSTSICFDLSVFEIFVTWSAGGKIILAENALYLPTLPEKNEVTLINTVPSAMAELVRMEGVPGSVKVVNLAGEALPAALVEQIYAKTAVEKVFNLYGPTEDTTYSTFTLVPRGTSVTIGRPIANSQAYILDSRLSPVPIGVSGELYLAGEGLARGYYGRPDMTSERFVANPFGGPQARMYRTGDLARWLPDGNIEYLGRIDHQVKLRGFRIELGEIETALNAHTSVRQSLVMAREDEPGNQRLVAYVVPKSDSRGAEVSSLEASQHADLGAELRRWLAEKLPEFMVPSAFVVLDAMPLSPNGKINREALPVPEQSRDTSADCVAPRTPLEETLAKIWSEVLHVEKVGVQDNFFSLGGHSLLATQVISRIRQATGIEPQLRYMFESPTIAEIVVKIEKMKAVGSMVLPPVQRAPRDQALPLSFAQQRLWFLDQLDPDNPLYNVPLAMRLSGTLNVDSLKRALNEVIRRHEVLRTHYVVENDLPVQVIADDVKIEVPIEDLSALPHDAQESAIRRTAIEKGRRVFDLRTGPVFRSSLLKLGEQEHVLLLNSHHIANDGWSIWQFANELGPLYEAFVEGKPSPLPELPVQYADFAVSQRIWLQSEILDKQLVYWTKQLEGAPGTLELPTDRPRPAVPTSRGTTEKVILPRELADRLIDLSRREGATLFMTLLAAYQTMLYRYTAQEDIVVGSPIANRNRAEIEDLIGLFVNTLIMRTDLSGSPTFRQLLQRVKDVALGAYGNQDLPFDKLVEALHPERELGRIPLFQVWFVLQNAPKASLQLKGLELRGIDVHNSTAKFDMGLFVTENPDGLYCIVEYSTELFEAATIKRLLAHYRVLLEAIVEDADRRIDELPMLPPEEERRLLAEWNDTSRSFARDRCIHELFERQVERTPDNTAVVFEGNSFTYRELNQRANQLAHKLRALGIRPDTLVGICVERSLEMLVALLGVLKAGGGYLPLDPAYPKDRRAFMLEDAQVPVLLTQSELLAEVPQHQGVTICLDTDWPVIASEPVENPAPQSNPENVAYVIYTSGSTGKPKGVMVTHANVARLFTSTDHWFNFGPQDTWTLFHSFAFDFSVWEIWGALLYGGRLIVVPLLTARSPEQFHELLVQQQVTVLNQTPSAFRQLIVADQESCNWNKLALRYVVFGGEALEFKTLLPWIERHGDKPALINMYGITETTVHVMYHKIDTPSVGEGTVSLVGVPIPDLQVYILDSQRNLSPIGVPGEMYVGGHGVARGYLHRAELTAQRFVKDPYNPDPHARLYKTGDLARFLPDGNIQYLGRIDHQVKIRGFRIELGEIETTLDSHPGVRQSVVMAREDVPGDKRLVAYIVPDPSYRGENQDLSEQALSGEQVAQWTEAFDEAYRRGGGVAEATFNITGWDSSYTGDAIPADEMRVWVETTVERIRGLRPKSVWEIGCGTGLLLFRLAPGTERYYGTDISQTALGFLQKQLQRPELRLPQLTLERRAAHEFDQEQVRGQFDAVVLNSVIQYFPDLDYFMKVLEGAVDAVRPGGAVFVGDVRSLPLLEAFHTSVELFKAEDGLGREELWQRVQKGIRQEGELLIDPDFFHAVAQRWPQVSHVEIQLKRGYAHNELTRFRYDVVLHVGEQAPPRVDCAWLDWTKQGLTRGSVAEILQKTQPEMLGLTAVPNARLSEEASALKMLMSDDGPATAGELRERLRSSALNAVEPEYLWSLGNELPYQIEVRPSKVAVDGHCDVVLRRVNPQGEIADYTVPDFPGEADPIRAWSAYANNPLRQRVIGKLVPQIRMRVAEKLPEYMMPSAFVLLDSMPLTANGKVNRQALPAPDTSHQEGQADYIAPRTPVEEIVSAIFSDVLRVDRVGTEDDFFELGGHSLSATQVVSRIRHNLHVDLPVRSLFEAPTVAGLARAVEQRQRGEKGLLAPPLLPVSRNQRLPLSFAQQRLWVLDQIEPNNPLYNFPTPMRLRGTLNVAALESALNGIVARHEILRTNYDAENGQPFQVIAAEQKVPLRVVDLSALPKSRREQEAQRLVQEQASTPFDLSKDPITRNLLLKMDDLEHILLLMTHHIASDGWSAGVLLREMTSLYEAALLGRTSDLPELSIQYADFAVWQRNWLQGGVLEQQLAYWKQQLAGAPPVLLLPTDRPRPEKPTFRGSIHRFKLPATLVESIRVLCRQEGGTLFMTLLAAFQTLILHYTKQPDIVLGTDLANRTTIQTEALIGFFVNLLALRTDLSGDPPFSELVSRVREVALGAYAHQDVPFDKLVEELQPERSLSHNPLVQVLFVQENTPRATAPMPGLTIDSFPMEVPSKFDMAVFVSETGEGVSGSWLYNPDLFDGTSIARMVEMYQLVLERVTTNPTLRLSQLLELLAEEDRQHRSSKHKEFQELSLQKLKSVKRKTVTRD